MADLGLLKCGKKRIKGALNLRLFGTENIHKAINFTYFANVTNCKLTANLSVSVMELVNHHA